MGPTTAKAKGDLKALDKERVEGTVENIQSNIQIEKQEHSEVAFIEPTNAYSCYFKSVCNVSQMEFPIIIIWTSPFPFNGC